MEGRSSKIEKERRMTSMVDTQGQKDGYFFVRLTADGPHSVIFRNGNGRSNQKRMGDGFGTVLQIGPSISKTDAGRDQLFAFLEKSILHIHANFTF
jgi:hypothetical protein